MSLPRSKVSSPAQGGRTHCAPEHVTWGHKSCPVNPSDKAAHACRGFTSLAAAAQDAEACLSAAALPAPVSAPALQIAREGLQHCPSKEEWQATMNTVHGSLSASSDTVHHAVIRWLSGTLAPCMC